MDNAKRLEKELISFHKTGTVMPEGCADVSLVDESNFFLWKATLRGNVSSPYAGGVFTLLLDIPKDYPMKPPVLKFSPPVLHPSVSMSTGEVCGAMPALAEWKPTMTIRMLIETVCGMLLAPSAENVLEPEIGQMLKERPNDFAAAVKKHMQENKQIKK
eukprot:PhM_4_TR4495/c0_g1_i2/m.61904/K06689/UBE2D, UBC4, UBC5; ubiquitin-conjugating enzyme E2 D